MIEFYLGETRTVNSRLFDTSYQKNHEFGLMFENVGNSRATNGGNLPAIAFLDLEPFSLSLSGEGKN